MLIVRWAALDPASRARLLRRGADWSYPELGGHLCTLVDDVRNNGDDALIRRVARVRRLRDRPGGSASPVRLSRPPRPRRSRVDRRRAPRPRRPRYDAGHRRHARNIGHELAYLRWVFDRSGVDVVHGCGLYIDESRPSEVVGPPDGYREAILAQFDDHSGRPAVIAEIGSGDPITPAERANLIGAAMPQAELGVPLNVHLHMWTRRGLEVLDLIAEHGADVERTVLCSLDVQIPVGLDYHRKLLRRGCLIAFDIWGDEFRNGDTGMPTDNERLEATLRLIAEGFGDRLVYSHDVCTKAQLRCFGGLGFSHLSGTVRARMKEAGLDEAETRRQLAGNALDLLLADGRGRGQLDAAAPEERGDA